MKINPTPCFDKPWHKFALTVFIASWTTMLLPMLVSPESVIAGVTLFTLLTTGTIAVLSLGASQFLLWDEVPEEQADI